MVPLPTTGPQRSSSCRAELVDELWTWLSSAMHGGPCLALRHWKVCASSVVTLRTVVRLARLLLCPSPPMAALPCLAGGSGPSGTGAGDALASVLTGAIPKGFGTTGTDASGLRGIGLVLLSVMTSFTMFLVCSNLRRRMAETQNETQGKVKHLSHATCVSCALSSLSINFKDASTSCTVRLTSTVDRPYIKTPPQIQRSKLEMPGQTVDSAQLA